MQSPTRLSDYCIGIFNLFPSRKGIKKAIKRGEVYVNGLPAQTGFFLKKGDVIELKASTSKPNKIFELTVPVVYEDDYLAVMYKPSGLPTTGYYFRTLQNTLAFNLKPSQQSDALPVPHTVHRLDAATSGLVIAAKTAQAHIGLGKIFEERKIKKTYQAVVIGKIADGGSVYLEIDNKKAESHFRLLDLVPSLRNSYLSLAEIEPKSGRTHQIRKHLSWLNHPIFGDQIYGKKGEVYLGKGLFLAAVALDFMHPISQDQLNIKIEPPAKFLSLLKREERRWKRVTGA